MPRAASAAIEPFVGARRDTAPNCGATAGMRRTAVTIGSASAPPGFGEQVSRLTAS